MPFLSQLHELGACSSLILHQLDTIRPNRLEKWLRECFEPNDVEKIRDELLGRDYDATDFAFVVVSTSSSMEDYEEVLRHMGFYETNRVQKKKNPKNPCKFWVIELPNLLEHFGYTPEMIKKAGLELLDH